MSVMQNSEDKVLEQALHEITSIQKRIQNDMLGGQLLKGTKPIDKEDVNQMHGFLNEMTANVQKEANKFINKKYFTKQQQEELKEAQSKSPEAVAELRDKFDKENPQARAARENMNLDISKARLNATKGLVLYIENIGSPKVDVEAVKENREKLIKEELVEVILQKAIKDAKLGHKSDKVTEELKDTLLNFNIKDLRNPKLQENLTSSLENTKQLSTRQLGTYTISRENLKEIAHAVSQGNKVEERSVKNFLMKGAKKMLTMGSKPVVYTKPQNKSQTTQR
jgi:hypothetical protein